MANGFTGDFDVVVEFSINAADRVLAAMHANERFLHSVSLRVDDNPPPGSKVPRPSIGGSTDAFGDPVVNHKKIGLASSLGTQTAANPLSWVRGNTIVNPNLGVSTDPPVVPSHLQGRAQLQLSPPMIDVPDSSGAMIRVRMEVMSRYFPDPQTSPAVEFTRGELVIMAPVSPFASNAARMVEIDIKSNQVFTYYSPLWTSRPLSAEDLAGINLLIRNALKTGFLPSSTPLPDKLTHLQFKTLVGGRNAIAVLLNMVPLSGTLGSGSPPGHPGTVNTVFLGAGDDFAFAVGKNYVQAAFPNATDHRFPKIWIYSISVGSPTVDFQPGQHGDPGQILLTFHGDAHTDDSIPFIPHDIGFSVQQALTLSLVASTPGGPLDTAQLVPKGDVSIHIDGLPDWASGLFTGGAVGPIRDMRDQQLASINSTVRDTLNANTNLGQFLRSMLVPSSGGVVTDHRGITIQLSYTSFDIQSSAIVLHGLLTVPSWRPTYVEYEEIPPSSGPGRGVIGPRGNTLWEGTDYSALKTWIPGGLIKQFEWYHQGQAQPYVDPNRFVLLSSPPQTSIAMAAPAGGAAIVPPGIDSTGIVSGFAPLCLTVRGLRVPSAGSGPLQPVSATICGYSSFPVLNASFASQAEAPMIALTQPSPQGLVQVTGHAVAQVDRAGGGVPNAVVYYPDNEITGGLAFLTQAMRDSGRKDAATVFIVVPKQLTGVPHVPGVTYGDNRDGAWERAYGVQSEQRPLLLIAEPNKGTVVWQHRGQIDAAQLSAALRKFLTPGGATQVTIPWMGLRMGAPPPVDFLFNYTVDRQMPLSKLKGRPVTLAFCDLRSKHSLDAVRYHEKSNGSSAGSASVLLVIANGATPEGAKKAAAESGLSAVVVPDPNGQIALAFGAPIVPTFVHLDAHGWVWQVRYGWTATETSTTPGGKSAAAK